MTSVEHDVPCTCGCLGGEYVTGAHVGPLPQWYLDAMYKPTREDYRGIARILYAARQRRVARDNPPGKEE